MSESNTLEAVKNKMPDELFDDTENDIQIENDEENNGPKEGSDSYRKPSTSRETPHSKPDWLEDLKKNFDSDIIQVCSNNTKTAVENNEKIEVICSYLWKYKCS